MAVSTYLGQQLSMEEIDKICLDIISSKMNGLNMEAAQLCLSRIGSLLLTHSYVGQVEVDNTNDQT